MAMPRLYFDYNAGAPLRGEARHAMVDALENAGNASSVHGEGRNARARIEKARRQVARLVQVEPSRIVFTSGGTEANVTALSPVMRVGAGEIELNRLFVGATEHPSVLSGGRFRPEQVSRLGVDGDGVIDLAALESRLAASVQAGEKALVSVMLANNETGTIQPVAEVAKIARRHGALSHSDAIQALGRIPVAVGALGVDFLTLSAHKIGGPQGVGALVMGGDIVTPAPMLRGGGQEKYARGGTENVAAIVGFGAAAEVAAADLERAPLWSTWRDKIATASDAAILSAGAERLPQTVSLALDGVAAETLVIALDIEGVAISAGSACSSGKVTVSHVMAAMGVAQEKAKAAVRVSFGWGTREEDIERFIDIWRRVAARLVPAGARAA